jgi:hypothetical protein
LRRFQGGTLGPSEAVEVLKTERIRVNGRAIDLGGPWPRITVRAPFREKREWISTPNARRTI